MVKYSIAEAVAFIGRRYFDDWQTLFPNQAHKVTNMAEDLEKLVGTFNDDFPGDSGQLGCVDLVMVHESSSKDIAQQTSYLVDLAKAETLSFRGELSDIYVCSAS
jgi:hypothetical protein